MTGQQRQLADGKLAFLQRLDHFEADRAGGADNGYVGFGVHADNSYFLRV
jgi:hypothetical protein